MTKSDTDIGTCKGAALQKMNVYLVGLGKDKGKGAFGHKR